MIRRAVLRLFGLLIGAMLISQFASQASAQNADALMRLLQSGRLPAERLPNVIDAIGKRGSATDLGYLLERATQPDGFPLEVQEATLVALADAAQSRGVVPEADPSRLVGLLASDSNVLRGAAVRVAGRWKDPSFVAPLAAIGERAEITDRAVIEAGEALAAIGSAEALATLTRWMNEGEVPKRRAAAAAALVASGDETAADSAIQWALQAPVEIDPATVVQAFLARQGGADRLAAILQDAEIDADRAQRFLRAMYAVGRSDEALVTLLTERGGLEPADAEWSAERMAEVVARVAAEGDPARGELVFRRRELTCFNCHALSGAGGVIGPDLSAVGNSSPPDYLINAILKPEQDVKEVYRMFRVLTIDGLLVAGVKVSEDDQTFVLKDAEGKTHVIPQEDIEDAVEGGSLMPRGLKVLMTDREFVDLIAFLSVLGKPGEYAVRSRATVQRWKISSEAELGMSAATSRSDAGIEQVAVNGNDGWGSIYAQVSGGLPLEDVLGQVMGETVFLQAEIDVVSPGSVAFQWSGPNAEIRIDSVAWTNNETPLELTAGRHRVTIRLSRDACEGIAMGEFTKPAGSSIDFTVVGGG